MTPAERRAVEGFPTPALRAARKARGIRLTEMCQRVGLTKSAYGPRERKGNAGSLQNAIRFARAIGCTVGELQGETPDPIASEVAFYRERARERRKLEGSQGYYRHPARHPRGLTKW